MSPAKLHPKGIIKIKGQISTTYDGVLDFAHQNGIQSLEVNPVQLPTKDNDYTAISSATVLREDGKKFTNFADATPDNVPHGCRDSFIRDPQLVRRQEPCQTLTTSLEPCSHWKPIYVTRTGRRRFFRGGQSATACCSAYRQWRRF